VILKAKYSTVWSHSTTIQRHHFVLPMESGSDVASEAWRQQRDVSSTRRHNLQLITSPSRRICIDDGSAS